MHRECAERSLVRMDELECPMCGAEVGGGGWDGYNYHQLKHDDIRLYMEEENDDDEAEQEKKKKKKKEVEGAKPKKK